MSTPTSAPDFDTLEKTVEYAAERLWTALDWYWPAFGDNGIGESNAVIALIRALDDARLKRETGIGPTEVYGESPYFRNASESEQKARLDLLFAVHDSRSVCLTCAVEAKRLFNTSSAESMTNDIKRLRRFELDYIENNEENALVAADRHYGMILGLTQHHQIPGWWSDLAIDSSPSSPPEGNESEAWIDLGKEVASALGTDGKVGHFSSADHHPDRAERYFSGSDARTVYLLYAIFDLKRQASAS